MGSQGHKYEAAVMVPIPPHRSVALGFFRSSVCFVLAVGAFAQDDPKTKTILITLIFAMDALSWHLLEAVNQAANSVYNRVWHDTLSNRLAMEAFVDAYRSSERIDVDALVKTGTVGAGADIEKYLIDNTFWYNSGWFKKAALGLGHFVWFWVSYGIFYGLAATAAAFLHM